MAGQRVAAGTSAARLLRVLVVGALVAALAVAWGAAPAAAAPALSLDRSTGLLDGDVVIATGSGFEPGARVRLVQCIGPTEEWCPQYPPVNGNGAVATVRNDGTLTGRLRLWRSFDVPAGTDQDCTHSDCSVNVLGPTGELLAQAFFDVADVGEATRPVAALTVTTTATRANRVVTSWTGSGFDPTFSSVPYDVSEHAAPIGFFDETPGAYLALCVPVGNEEDCTKFQGATLVGPNAPNVQWLWSFPVDAAGRVSRAGVTVPRVLSIRDTRLDCAVAGCRLALTQDDFPLSRSSAIPWAPEWAPYPSATAMVSDAYLRLMGRPPTAAERAAAVAGLTDRSLLARDFVTQLTEWPDGRRYAELARLYKATLNRRPDGRGLAYWADELRRNGGSMAAIAGAFGRTAEFRTQYGPSVSDAQAVRNAYLFTLGRDGSATERAYWVGRLQAGMSRTHLVHLFSRTPEFVAYEGPRSRATAVAVGLLGRGPTSWEWDTMTPFWFVLHLPPPVRVEDQLLAYLGSDVLRTRVG